MARHLFAILDDLTTNLAELKATLAPLALIGGTVVAEAKKPAFFREWGPANADYIRSAGLVADAVNGIFRPRQTQTVRPLS